MSLTVSQLYLCRAFTYQKHYICFLYLRKAKQNEVLEIKRKSNDTSHYENSLHLHSRHLHIILFGWEAPAVIARFSLCASEQRSCKITNWCSGVILWAPKRGKENRKAQAQAGSHRTKRNSRINVNVECLPLARLLIIIKITLNVKIPAACTSSHSFMPSWTRAMH